MIPNDQWRQDMQDGVDAVFHADRCGCGDVAALRASIKQPIDHHQMNRDTSWRTGGKCPTWRDYLQRQFTRLEEAMKKTFRSDSKSE